MNKYNKLFEDIFSKKKNYSENDNNKEVTRYRKLFEPIKIGSIEIKNRIVFAPLCNTGMLDTNGSFTQQAVEYYCERAKGGAGLIVSGAAKVENEVEKIVPGHNGRAIISISGIPKITEIAEVCHYYGAKFFVQLFAGDGYNNPLPNTVGPSENPTFFREGETTRELSQEEIEKIVVAFGDAAGILRDCGVDGVELNGHEGYLLDNFSAAIWNKRTDRYGGDLKARLTFAKEIFEAIRSSAGNDFAITYKYGLKHFIKALKSSGLKEGEFAEAGRDIEEGIEMAKLLEEIGYQSLIIDAGCYDSMYWVHPTIYQEHGYLVKYAEVVKKAVDIPIVAIGSLDIPDLAEGVLSEGRADMIALGRPLLADPYWPEKVKKGEIEDILPCIGCNEGCLARALKEKTLSCAVNPAAGSELYFKLEPTVNQKKVFIAGGGVAGMEAARTLAIRGHNVILYEKSSDLGGHLIEASVPDFKKDIARLLEWYRRQMKKFNIKIKMNTELTSENIRIENPEVVIVATGSFNIVHNITGINRSNVIYATDLLLGKKEIDGKVIVVGGGMIGLEVALWITKKGKKVKVIEALPEVAIDGVLSNKDILLDLLAYHGVEIRTNAELVKVTDEYIEMLDKRYNAKHTMEYDSLVLSTGLYPQDSLYKTLESGFSEMDVYAIGDCRKPGKIISAIWDAYHIARSI